jgi:hypothetical protein
MYIYLDESGDLGFREESTKFFTIAFIVMEDSTSFKRHVRKVKVKYNIPAEVELKGYTTREVIKGDLLKRFAGLDIEVHAITVMKKNFEPKLRRDTNILYNYMVGLSLVERIIKEPEGTKVIIDVDKRIISVTSGFNFDKYLRYKIWYERERRDIDLDIHHLESHQAYSIQGIDIICNSIFRKYNSRNYRLFNIIKSKVVTERRLFFDK